MTRRVPFVDLQAEWQPLKDETLRRIAAVLEHGRFVAGPEVGQLEERLAREAGAAHAISCASGTTALLMAMLALEIGPGDEVVMPAYTFAAPAECAMLLGASPVFVDVSCPSGLVDAAAVNAAITPRTKAIVAVSLYGLPAGFKAINAVASRHGIPVIEDAAQSFGAALHGRRSGSLALIGCTSFFPTKGLGGAGDGGAVFTDDAELAECLRQIRDHGQSGRYRHQRLGLNGRLNSIAAAALLVRLDGFDAAIAQRRRVGDAYDARLSDARTAGLLDFTVIGNGTASARAQYAVLVDDRDAVAADLHAAGIETAVHYPVPLHRQPAFACAPVSGSLQGAEAMASTVLCLPIYPGLAPEDVDRVADALCGILRRRSAGA